MTNQHPITPSPELVPTPVEPVAWMYRGESDFDGTTWRENWQVTTNHRLAVFKAQPEQPIPLAPITHLPL